LRKVAAAKEVVWHGGKLMIERHERRGGRRSSGEELGCRLKAAKTG
jgi:hypothetical protein